MTIEKSESNGRVLFYDNVKFVMITLVVVGHFADVFTYCSDFCKSVFLFIYAFHMPMMLFISGLFYSDNRNTSKVFYYICGGFAMKIGLLIIDGGTSFSLLSDAGLPWFLFVLAAYQILMHVLRNMDKRFLLFFSILLACFVGYDTTVGDYLYLSRMIIFFPYYLLGTMLKPQRTYSFFTKHAKKLVIPAFLVIAVWFYFCFFRLPEVYDYRYLFTGRNSFFGDLFDYGPLARLLCYSISVLTGASLLVLIPKIRIPFFSALGSRTLNVYFWHWIVYSLLDNCFHISNVFFQGKIGKISFLFMAVLLSIVLSSVKVFEYPLIAIKRQCFRIDNADS